jgi:hypothetical protein
LAAVQSGALQVRIHTPRSTRVKDLKSDAAGLEFARERAGLLIDILPMLRRCVQGRHVALRVGRADTELMVRYRDMYAWRLLLGMSMVYIM